MVANDPMALGVSLEKGRTMPYEAFDASRFPLAVREEIDARWFDVDAVPVPAMVVPINYPTDWHIERHAHKKSQLIYCISGVMTVETLHGQWVAPPNRGIWVPGGIEHEVVINQAAAMRTVFVAQNARANLPNQPFALAVTKLLRELVLSSVATNSTPDSALFAPGTPMAHITEVLLDQIVAQPASDLHLPYPSDRRLKPICMALTSNPADRRSLKDWAKVVGASDRTVERLFMAETGMTFHRWREQMRVLRSLTLLANGRAVKNVALELGFANPSTFITMFRKTMGITPGAYLKGDNEPRASA